MFGVYHFIWLGICALLAALAAAYLRRHKPPLRRVLGWACAGCVVSEVVKILSVIELVPSADGSRFYPYLELAHLPFHLCSAQIALIFYARYAKDGPARTAVLAFMYPSCLIGALMAIVIATTFGSSADFAEAFLRPLTYQYFLYHTMLVVLGLYIPLSREVELRPRHYLSTMAIVVAAGFVSFYLNSAFAVPVYSAGELLSVEYTTNFLYTFAPPVDFIRLTEPWHWYVYVLALGALAALLVALLYIPVFRRAKSSARGEKLFTASARHI